MSPNSSRKAGFTIMELMMAMALFTIAAVSLAEALNVISLTVTESITDAEVREQLRAVMLEVTRDPGLIAEIRETNPTEDGLVFKIETERLDLKNDQGEGLPNLFSVRVTAIQESPGGRRETLDTAATMVNPAIF